MRYIQLIGPLPLLSASAIILWAASVTALPPSNQPTDRSSFSSVERWSRAHPSPPAELAESSAFDLAYFNSWFTQAAPAQDEPDTDFREAIDHFFADTDGIYLCVKRMQAEAAKVEQDRIRKLSDQRNSAWWSNPFSFRQRYPYISCFNRQIAPNDPEIHMTPLSLPDPEKMKTADGVRSIALGLLSTSFTRLLTEPSQFSNFVSIVGERAFDSFLNYFTGLHAYFIDFRDRFVSIIVGFVTRFLIRNLVAMAKGIIVNLLPFPLSTIAYLTLDKKHGASANLTSDALVVNGIQPVFGNATVTAIEADPLFNDSALQVQYALVIKEFQQEWHNQLYAVLQDGARARTHAQMDKLDASSSTDVVA